MSGQRWSESFENWSHGTCRCREKHMGCWRSHRLVAPQKIAIVSNSFHRWQSQPSPTGSPKSGFGGHAATTRAHGELVARLELGPAVLDEIILPAAAMRQDWSPM